MGRLSPARRLTRAHFGLACCLCGSWGGFPRLLRRPAKCQPGARRWPGDHLRRAAQVAPCPGAEVAQNAQPDHGQPTGGWSTKMGLLLNLGLCPRRQVPGNAGARGRLWPYVSSYRGMKALTLSGYGEPGRHLAWHNVDLPVPGAGLERCARIGPAAPVLPIGGPSVHRSRSVRDGPWHRRWPDLQATGLGRSSRVANARTLPQPRA